MNDSILTKEQELRVKQLAFCIKTPDKLSDYSKNLLKETVIKDPNLLILATELLVKK